MWYFFCNNSKHYPSFFIKCTTNPLSAYFYDQTNRYAKLDTHEATEGLNRNRTQLLPSCDEHYFFDALKSIIGWFPRQTPFFIGAP